MAAVSKEEYLKRYLSNDSANTKKKKKKRPKIGVKAPTMRIVDDDLDFESTLPENLSNTLDEDICDNDPTVAEVVDERPEHIVQLETIESYRKSNKWRTMNEDSSSKQNGQINSDSDQSPSRRKRHDSNSDQSPPRRQRHDSDSDQSPPRKTRHDSESDQSPPRKTRHDSDSDQSPPRKKRHDSDSDQSPPRKKRHNSDSDQSPPRRKRQDSDSDQSPPRRKRHKSDSDQSPPRKNHNTERTKKATKTLSGAKAGLSSAREMNEEAKNLRKKEADAFSKIDDDTLGKNATTVFRNRKSGRRRDMAAEQEETAEEAKRLAEQQAKYDRWGKGLKQAADQSDNISSAIHEMDKPMARYKDDADLDQMLKNKERNEDPMLEYIKKKSKNKKGPNKKEFPRYNGPMPPPNRFNLKPGYRWDGVDRSNGFEKKIFETQSNKRAVADEAYKWSTEDM